MKNTPIMIQRKESLLTLFLFLFVLSFTLHAEIPTGYYHAARGKSKGELKTTLSEISSPLFVLRYGSGEGATWEGFYNTDRINEDEVWDMYSEVTRYFNGYGSVADMDIEHSFPKSWWGGHVNDAYRDLHHLYPSDRPTNSAKNNFPLGEVETGITFYNTRSTIGNNSFGNEYSGRAFEPADEFKGDFARAYMYVVTIHENLEHLWNSPMLINELYPAWRPWAVDLLLKWHRQDPVSEKELVRNEVVYGIQGNRNPFIDHPELAEHIWGNRMDDPFDYPAETEPFLISPGRNYSLDMGVVFQQVNKKASIILQGVNISESLQLDFSSEENLFQLSKYVVTPEEAEVGVHVQLSITPAEAGVFSDTILIQGGGLQQVMRIPVRVVASPDFITLEPSELTPVGGKLHWLEDAEAIKYKLTLGEGVSEAGDLIISGYYEGLSNDKAVELYNGTGRTIDLSRYQLKKQTNGAGGFHVSKKLSGLLADKQTCLVVYSSSGNEELRSKAMLFSDSVAAFNGNDAIALFRDNIKIDIVGEEDGGAEYIWGLDKILKRKVKITHPNSSFDLNEWDEFSYVDLYRMNTHEIVFSDVKVYLFYEEEIGNQNYYDLDNLKPESQYTYSVISVRPGEEVISVNTQLLRTTQLEQPVALEASDFLPLSFTANWEDHPYTDQFELDLFYTSAEDGVVVVEEGFNGIGSNGKPLPEGWTGTVSGNYTTAASSGKNTPSVAFKNSNEWLKTPDYSAPVTKLSFMYRFPSGKSDSYFLLEAQNSSGWNRIDSISAANNSKHYPEYLFSAKSDYDAVRFIYMKSSGNFAIDDVVVEYGVIDTTYVLENKAVTGSSFVVSDLPDELEYFYRVRAQLGGKYSDWSEVIAVEVDDYTNVYFPEAAYNISLQDGNLILNNLIGNESVRLFSSTGVLLSNATAVAGTNRIPLNHRGVFILQILGGAGSQSHKLIY